MKRCTLILLVLGLSLMACQRTEVPNGVLDHDQMVAFLSEAYLIEGDYAVATHYAYDSVPANFEQAYDDLLAKLGVARWQVDSSFAYYAAHPDLYANIHTEVIAHLDSLR